MEIKQFDFRKEYYNDIHNMKPKWWMRWGIFSAFIILLIILSLGYAVKYPDMIKSEFRLTTNKPSITLPLKEGAQIEKILINNNDSVTPNTTLLIIKNNSNYKDVFLLKQAINNFSYDKNSIISFFNRFLDYDLELGDLIENDWIAFSSQLLDYYKIEELDSYQSQVDFLENELKRQYQLKREYSQLIITDHKQKILLDNKIKTDSILFSKGVVSKMEFNNKKINFHRNSKTLQQNNLALKRINLDIIKLKNSIENYSNNEKENLLKQKLGIRKSLNKLKSSIYSWERNFTLISPIKGDVTFIQDLKKDVFYIGNVLVVTPKEKRFYATLNIPFIGAGKVEEGQRVVLKLNDYPYREYGILEGVLKELSPVAGENYYLGKVEINEGKTSSYGKNIKVKENMSGLAEIITNDRSILGRLFERILYVFHK
ncbi:hypothetical protein [Tenacibaculum ovolyticum]|uniref:hypothetical protein n=1 Tax=Tenacibaculum ovolyticum TaxID=104270 RepID=UPI003BAB309A